MAGLFDTFTISKRGLNVQQANINTTSHNIANASTTGYSRQRAVIETTRPFGGTSRFDSCSAGQVGTGAEVTTIQRIRDYFKDYQVRSQNSINGQLDMKNKYLNQVEDILNETSDTGVQQALSDFYKGFQTLSLDPTKPSNRTVALQQAATLASALNNRYTQLETKKSDAQETMHTDVTGVNSILDQINSLNEQIAGVSAVGMTPNDLMDKRDNLLDDLSVKFGITTKKEKYDAMDVNSSELSTKLVDGNDFTGTGCNRFSYVESADLDASGNLTVKYSVKGDRNNIQTLTISGANEVLKTEVLEKRILIANKDGYVSPNSSTVSSSNISATAMESALFKVEKGEIGGNQDVQKDIQKSMDELDKFAAGLAYSVNLIQTGSVDGTANSNLKYNDPVFVTKASNDAGTPTDTGINAKNITVNSVLEKDPLKLNCGVSSTDVSGDKAGTRALAIADLKNVKMDFDKINVASTTTKNDFYTNSGLTFDVDKLNLNTSTSGSTIDNYYKSAISDLATTAKGVTSDLSNSETQLQIFQNDRLSESGVSLDEETANLIQYQHAYQANAKVMSTIDELLDVVINGLKR
ncbi:MAG: flagellar hook-associated protein FlgK [Clostridium beijerinckii]|jgi:flagellar hook-associated protein 1 FlgK|uniref:flagellar hook-associated protein FlgK n=1 Tax=Clostridium beijerinckii TaxID=1520 RepID=UPI001493F567|nr:flagellar hook-associated protein FlgK [Clostridium beijerinckii]MCI1477741.1 flagellar hook-associated protein FlgK [Clostridium beijerinckii]MCI1577943.1 flagellar hook-associated protein FlgK [Clostridium beijerinckii]MCI1583124.1 flagellar hook-associated protein FlgK [Clostridium beijerinckii]MCI1620646.1 flagellar hook-associated protein FlgK [Clostridium beijerinckii]NOW87883.1 flagellar hook-associated protein 1 FlgK [Clostridium beijerinckii]